MIIGNEKLKRSAIALRLADSFTIFLIAFYNFTVTAEIRTKRHIMSFSLFADDKPNNEDDQDDCRNGNKHIRNNKANDKQTANYQQKLK